MEWGLVGKETAASCPPFSMALLPPCALQTEASVPRQLSDSGWCWCQTPHQQPHAEAGPRPSLTAPVHHPGSGGPGTGSCLDRKPWGQGLPRRLFP